MGERVEDVQLRHAFAVDPVWPLAHRRCPRTRKGRERHIRLPELDQDVGDPDSSENRIGRSPSGPVSSGVTGFTLALLAFGVVRVVFERVPWKSLPAFISTFPGALLGGALVLGIGAALYLVRETQRFVYAYLELGSAFGAAVEACTRLASDVSQSTAAVALLGAVYIAVRGFDNLAQARRQRVGSPGQRDRSTGPHERRAGGAR